MGDSTHRINLKDESMRKLKKLRKIIDKLRLSQSGAIPPKYPTIMGKPKSVLTQKDLNNKAVRYYIKQAIYINSKIIDLYPNHKTSLRP